MVNLIQPITVQQAYDGITHARRWASWNWWWRMVDDDDGDGFPSPKPRMDSRSALLRKNGAWWRLRIIKRDESFSLIFSPRNKIYRVRVGVGGASGGPRGRGRAPHPRGEVVAPWPSSFAGIFYIFQKVAPWSFRSFRECLFLHINNTMEILLKTASVRVSSIQIMQVRVQNKGKSVWKSRYDRNVSTPPSLNICLSSSNSVDKLKVIKKNFYKLCLILLLQMCKAIIQVFNKDHELSIFIITFRSHVYSYQWHNQLASNNNKSRMTTLSQNNHNMI